MKPQGSASLSRSNVEMDRLLHRACVDGAHARCIVDPFRKNNQGRAEAGADGVAWA
jgi:hypothetical protein